MTRIRTWFAPSPTRVVLGLALMGIALFLGLDLKLKHDRAQARERDRLVTQTRVIEVLLDKEFISLNRVLGDLARDWANRRSDRDINDRLKTLTEAMPGVRTLFLLDSGGVIRASNRAEVLNKNFSQREYFKIAQQTQDPDMLYVNAPYTTVLGAYSLNLCRLIQGPRGEFAGIVSATLDPNFFAPLLESILYSPDMLASIVHSDGVLFLTCPERAEMTGTDLSRPGTFFSRHLQSGRSSNVFTGRTYVSGSERMLALSTIRPAGLKMDRTLVVTASRDRSAILEEWRRDVLWRSVLFLILAVGGCAGLYAYEARKREFDRQAVQAAQALRDSERFLRTIADHIPGMVGYWDNELRCAFANRSYLEWFGKTPEQMLGMHIQELMGEELFLKNEAHMRAVLAGEPQHFERALRKADGSIGHTLAHYIPDLAEGRVHGFFVLVSDVTEMKSAQLTLESRVAERTAELLRTVEALAAAKIQAESASRLKSEFLANLSHELRTPLNPMITLTELVLATGLTDEQREYLTEVHAASKRLLTLFNRLLELLELEGYTPVPGAVSLASLVELALSSVREQAQGKGLRLESSVSPELPPFIWSDFSLLRMAVLELLENAVRFTSQGQVSLRITGRRDASGETRLQVEIADTGMGIPEDRVAAIFTGLTQGDAPLTKRFGGLGIGLAKARKATELLAGRLELDSVTGQGTVFRLILPLKPFDLPEEGGPEYVCTPEGQCSWNTH